MNYQYNMFSNSKLNIFDIEQKCKSVLETHNKCLVSVSGGSDSDIMLDLIERTRTTYNLIIKIDYVFFNTGIESKATLEHLDYLEDRYKIQINRVRAKTPVPLGCKLYGVPFLTKFVSDMISRMQKHNFDFKNDGWKTKEELLKKYGKSGGWITWWTNTNKHQKGKKSMFNINLHKFLKEFLIENPPTFAISNLCCNGAKKEPSHEYEENLDIDLKCLGVRQAEGGIRSTAYKSCFSTKDNKNKFDNYRPLFFMTDTTKKDYELKYNIIHSKCYTEYGFKRTGCMGCPYNSRFEEDLEKIKEKEPNLYLGVNNIFGKSYEFTRKYREFKNKMEFKEKHIKGQIMMW